MRYDTIIIGGGLAGLVCGIALVGGGKRVGLVRGGRSSLGYFSGSLELLGGGVGELEGFLRREPSHPYAIIGKERIAEYTEVIKNIFRDAGVPLRGNAEGNHLRLTPLGVLKPAWLTLEDFVTFGSEELLSESVAIVGIEGNLDFNPEFVARPFRRRGAECVVTTLALTKENFVGFARRVAEVRGSAKRVLLPAIFSQEELTTLRSVVGEGLFLVPTASASMAGARVERALLERFRTLGGRVFQNQRATACRVESGKVVCLMTSEGESLEAEEYVLATGRFFGGGLVATPTRVYEPVVGVDVAFSSVREDWYAPSVLSEQPFERFGVTTDGDLHPSIGGVRVENLYAVGALLAGADGVTEACGGGVATLSALWAAEKILSR